MNDVIMYIVGGLVVMIVASALVPTALTAFHGANTTGWTTSEIAIFSVLGVLFVVGLLIGIVYMALRKK